MKISGKGSVCKADRKNERGAALVTALMISFLLLVASAGIILETTANSSNLTDATSEQQAYNAAESGIQSVVNVLRYRCTQTVSAASASGCRVKPSPLFDTSKPDYNKANWITYSRALDLATSNASTDTSTVPRLSRVLSYTGASADSRVKLGQPSSLYIPRTGFAYDLSISDPDNTGNVISYVTTGSFFDHDLGDSRQITFGSGADIMRIRYNPAVVANLSVPGGTVTPTNFGNFTVTVTGSGAEVTRLVRFEIIVQMTVPFPATRVIRGFIEPQNTAPFTTPPQIIFDSQTYDLRGSEMRLVFSGLTGYSAWSGTPAPAMRTSGSQPYGYEARLTGSSTGFANIVSGTVSPPEPARLLIRSVGYGPRGSVKTLEAIIQNNYFAGLGAPATVTLVGPPSTTNPATSFTFNPGNSNAMLYSGADAAAGSTDIIPPVGVTNTPDPITGDDSNLDEVIDGFGNKINNTVIGVPSNVSAEVPPWLATPAALDATVRTLYDTALNSYDPTNSTGRVFTNTDPTSFGDNATGTGITFCDGDCTLGPIAGGGILVVTGRLTLHGNFSWKGLIIVTGQAGVLRNGGGNGTLQGNIVVAPYVNSSIAANTDPPAGAGFLAPQWDTQGGGNSSIVYNSDNQNSGLGSVSNVVLGVVEK